MAFSDRLRAPAMIDDDNWYLQDDPPERKPVFGLLTWVLIIPGVILAIVTVVTVVLVLPEKLNRATDPLFDQFAEVVDDSQPVSIPESPADERQAQARQAIESRQVVEPAAAGLQTQRVRQAVREVHQALQTADDATFAELLNRAEFQQRVRSSAALSLTARSIFATEFSAWMEYYVPVSSQRTQIAAIRPGDFAGEWIAYTWVYTSGYGDYCSRYAWYFQETSGGQLSLIDFENLDDAALFSDQIAREFSGACTGRLWDHYIEILEFDSYEEASAEQSGNDVSARIRLLAGQPLPASVAHWGLLNLAQHAAYQDDYELCLEMLDQAEQYAQLPAIDWQRASALRWLDRHQEALAALQNFTARLGDGPDSAQLRAEILRDLGEAEQTADAVLQGLSFDSENGYLVTQFHSFLSPDRAADLAEILRQSPTPARSAARLAVQLLQANRGDLAEPLVQIARSVPRPTVELLLLDAELARRQGQSDRRLQALAQAVQRTPATDDQFSSRLYLWSSVLAEQDRHADAVRESPDPASTFVDLALDEGEVYVELTTLQEMAAALDQATPAGIDAADRLKLWRRIAPPLIALKQQDYESAWQDFRTLLLTHQAELEDAALTWEINEWAVEAAVHSGHLADVLPLLPEEDRFASVVWHVESLESAELLRQLMQLEPPDDAEQKYWQGVVTEFEGQPAAAIQQFLDFLNHPDSEDNWRVYSARNRVLQLHRQLGRDWQDLIADVPVAQAIELLGSDFQQKHRPEEMARLLQHSAVQDADPALTIDYAVWLHRWNRNWPALLSLYRDWQAAGLADAFDPDQAWQTADTRSAFLDAFLSSGQFDQARLFAEQFAGTYEIDDWNAKIAVCRGQKNHPDLAAEVDSDLSQWLFDDVTGPILWSDNWAEYRRQHPPEAYQLVYGYDATWNYGAVLLQKPLTVDAEQLQASLAAEFDDVAVADVTAELTAAGTELLAETGDPAASAAKSDSLKLFRVTLDNQMSLLMGYSTGRFEDADQTDATSDNDLSADLKTAFEAHEGWISFQREWTRPGLGSPQSEALIAKALAAIADQDSALLYAGSQLQLLDSSVRQTLQQGYLQSLELPGNLYFYVSEPTSIWQPEDDRAAEKSRYELVDRLTRLNPQADHQIRVWTLLPGTGYTIPVSCRLVRWTPQYGPSNLVVELPDSPLVAEAYRGELVQVSIYSVSAWSEDSAAGVAAAEN